MTRPVDAEALEKKISEWLGQPGNGDYYSGYDAALCAVQDLIADTPTLTPPNEPLISGFDVIDTKTGEYPDLWEIALKEDWANGLMYCDMEGFAIEEDGTLLLLDECGKHAYCPEGRFKIVPRPPEGEEDT